MGGKEHGATSAFSGSSLPLVIILLLDVYLALQFPDQLFSHVPLFIIFPLTSLKKGMWEVFLSTGLGVVWTVWNIVVTLPLRLYFGPITSALSSALPLLTLMLIVCRKNKAVMSGGALGFYWIRVFWDPPLMIMVYICWGFNFPFLHDGANGFLTIIDDNIAISSMPLAMHENILKQARIKGVINMQVEYGGPVSMYERAGIKQLRLPTLDTTCPSEEALEKGLTFIRSTKEESPDMRVLIHCKGGRGRAITMALAWLTFTGHTIEDGFRSLKEKRKVAEPVVQGYPALCSISAKYNNGN